MATAAATAGLLGTPRRLAARTSPPLLAARRLPPPPAASRAASAAGVGRRDVRRLGAAAHRRPPPPPRPTPTPTPPSSIGGGGRGGVAPLPRFSSSSASSPLIRGSEPGGGTGRGGVGSGGDEGGGGCDHVVPPHCDTCTCGAVGGRSADGTALAEAGFDDAVAPPCDIARGTTRARTMPLPPPLPEPKFSFHKRVMPPNLISLSSPEGKGMFLESLSSGYAESYFPLAEQFLNQSDPAFCGVTTLCMVLNAMSVDPNVRWRGGWRWYGDDSVVLSNCCLSTERVRRVGISMEEFASLGRCQGARIVTKRPRVDGATDGGTDGGAGGVCDLEEFRDDVRFAVRHPPQFVPEDGTAAAAAPPPPPSPPGDDDAGGYLVVSFARPALSQTGEGHYSPVAAYHIGADACLVLDVARFKYAPYWVSVPGLYGAMGPADETTGRSRGWFLMRPPRGGRYGGAVKADEGRRPVEVVRRVGEGDVCPVGEIKVEFCRARRAEGGGMPDGEGSRRGG